MAEHGPSRRPSRHRLSVLLWLTTAISFGFAEPFGNTNNHQQQNGANYGIGQGGGGGGGGGVGIHIGGGINLGLGESVRCPKVCSCSGQSVDCSRRGLTQVPRRIPLDTEKL